MLMAWLSKILMKILSNCIKRKRLAVVAFLLISRIGSVWGCVPFAKVPLDPLRKQSLHISGAQRSAEEMWSYFCNSHSTVKYLTSLK
ncbi:hypothetical protein CEXT_505781 [Caerostris extrusa]|uniref:Secreted protein n=1 Tax=Caerostris extrusa TaxID=172846 RepID=A0AAV4MJH5_CAEEX|nr:hypothetical protein CEXT_505781 [Caerostris extrusa]